MGDYIYLIAPIFGWIIAQSIKFVLTLRKDGVTLSDAVQSGGMPSSHAAFMVALTTVVGLNNGIASVSFGIAFALTCVIIYDSVGVRYTTGQQTIAINKLAKASNIKISALGSARGHTIPEAIVGSLVGALVGFAVYNIL